jgi:hypothetical protein
LPINHITVDDAGDVERQSLAGQRREHWLAQSSSSG